MDIVKFYQCYDFNSEWYLIEMVLDVACSDIDWIDFHVPCEDLDESEWQCAYMEQYLNESGTAKICETYDEPEEDITPCRVGFFICKDGGDVLRTPYGDFTLTDGEKVPERLKNIIEFEED